MSPHEPYYRADLALVHHRGFGFHADACAPGILRLLDDVRQRDGVVLELGCGTGLLTRHLVDAGHRVIATDASPAMLELASQHVRGAQDIRPLVLPHDPIPEVDAIVSVGHVLSYLDTVDEIERSLASIARAIRPGGVMALDLCDVEWGRARIGAPPAARVADDWAIVTRFSMPSPDRFVRDMTTFVRNDDDTWRRDDERHENVLIDTDAIPKVLSAAGIDADVRSSFGTEELPEGLRVVIGRRARGSAVSS